MIARSKKAQITAFLIVGVAMVLIVVTLVFIRNFSVKKTIEKEMNLVHSRLKILFENAYFLFQKRV